MKQKLADNDVGPGTGASGLAHICVFTRDMRASLSFYVGYFGFRLVYDTTLARPEGKLRFAVVKCGSCIVELLEPESGHGPGGPASIDHFALEVGDCDAMRARAAEMGIKVVAEVFEIAELLDGVKGFFVEGPSGEKIELFEYRDKPGFL